MLMKTSADNDHPGQLGVQPGRILTNVYKGTSGTGSVVATFYDGRGGPCHLSTPLEDRTYSVKEVTPPKGYQLVYKVYTFTINRGRMRHSAWRTGRAL